MMFFPVETWTLMGVAPAPGAGDLAGHNWQVVLGWLVGGLFCLWICLRLAPTAEALWEAAVVLIRRPMIWILPLVTALAGGVTVWQEPLWQADLAGNLGLAFTRTVSLLHHPVPGAALFLVGALMMVLNLYNCRREASYQARTPFRWWGVQIYLLALAPLYLGAAALLWWNSSHDGLSWFAPALRQIAEGVLWLGHAHGALLLLTAIVIATTDWCDNVRSGLGEVQLWIRAIREWPRLFPLAWIHAQLQLAHQWLTSDSLAMTWLQGVLQPVFLILLLALPVILAGCRVRFGEGGGLALLWWLRRPLSCAWLVICGALTLTVVQVSIGFLHAYVGIDSEAVWWLITAGIGGLIGTWLVVGWVILIYDDDWLDAFAVPSATRPY